MDTFYLAADIMQEAMVVAFEEAEQEGVKKKKTTTSLRTPTPPSSALSHPLEAIPL